MPTNYGKAWEQKIKQDFVEVDGATIDRLYDSVSGYKSISNISDFIGYIHPNIFYLEAKSCKGNTFPLAKLTQYDKLLCKVGVPGVRAGVLLWFIEHEKVLYVPISTFTKLREDGKKSVNIKMIDDDTYNIKVVPSEKRRVFLDCDYSFLRDLKDGE
jgi:penicillin-binding protein-related factor A (putative recombinase)